MDIDREITSPVAYSLIRRKTLEGFRESIYGQGNVTSSSSKHITGTFEGRVTRRKADIAEFASSVERSDEIFIGRGER